MGFLDQLNSYELLKPDPVSWSWSIKRNCSNIQQYETHDIPLRHCLQPADDKWCRHTKWKITNDVYVWWAILPFPPLVLGKYFAHVKAHYITQDNLHVLVR